MLTRIESTVSVTTRHSDSAPTASVAAMALASRAEATGAGRLAKPAVPGDRIMVYILQDAERIIRGIGEFRSVARQYCGVIRLESGKTAPEVNFGRLLLTFGVSSRECENARR